MKSGKVIKHDRNLNSDNSIVIIGAGNLGSCLANFFIENKFNLIQIIDENIDKLNFNPNYSGKYSSEIKDLNIDADLIILAVNDQAVARLISHFPVLSGLVVHTSGCSSIDLFADSKILNYGVLYPLQTFTVNQQIDFSKLPFFIEANNQDNLLKLDGFCSIITSEVYQIDSERRRIIHLAAVFASNFSNYMYFCAEKLLVQANLPREILKPLIQQTAEKACLIGAFNAQTGPAVRNDQITMRSHLQMLEDDANFKAIYQLISESIYKTK